ncbi:hypothetical protein A8L34_27735 [Bacillus sp. FJAT-27264]|uniref:hypothetical protein n=1 Tax=Paenibacillus sp. (strain DSM 101736 / FJAT-27264) TaxID=1850362 RepID=UPI000807A545|nr:hypothetical protein [Bacillus sp. FJAT-27264]OBZ15843.1 hypothetical protein A8L34_27735 [Bacillus sp. FJAT-27264]
MVDHGLIAYHQELEVLRNQDPEKLLLIRLMDIVKTYLDGQMSAADILKYTNLDPEAIDLFGRQAVSTGEKEVFLSLIRKN